MNVSWYQWAVGTPTGHVWAPEGSGPCPQVKHSLGDEPAPHQGRPIGMVARFQPVWNALGKSPRSPPVTGPEWGKRKEETKLHPAPSI